MSVSEMILHMKFGLSASVIATILAGLQDQVVGSEDIDNEDQVKLNMFEGTIKGGLATMYDLTETSQE